MSEPTPYVQSIREKVKQVSEANRGTGEVCRLTTQSHGHGNIEDNIIIFPYDTNRSEEENVEMTMRGMMRLFPNHKNCKYSVDSEMNTFRVYMPENETYTFIEVFSKKLFNKVKAKLEKVCDELTRGERETLDSGKAPVSQRGPIARGVMRKVGGNETERCLADGYAGGEPTIDFDGMYLKNSVQDTDIDFDGMYVKNIDTGVDTGDYIDFDGLYGKNKTYKKDEKIKNGKYTKKEEIKVDGESDHGHENAYEHDHDIDFDGMYVNDSKSPDTTIDFDGLYVK